MLKSMTGFGKGRAGKGRLSLSLEIRSVNSRYFEVSYRLPNGFGSLEERIRNILKRKLKRGHVTLNLLLPNSPPTQDVIFADLDLARRYQAAFRRLQKALNIKADLSLSQIINLPHIIEHKTRPEAVDELWPLIARALTRALNNLTRAKEKEGRMLYRDIAKRLKKINAILKRIEARRPGVVKKYRLHLLEKAREISPEEKDARLSLAEEVAAFARNYDIAEEISRSKAHLKSFKAVLSKVGESGRRLDFIAQEMFREINTLTAKAGDFKISRWAIEIKGEIEKVREQLQNVE